MNRSKLAQPAVRLRLAASGAYGRSQRQAATAAIKTAQRYSARGPFELPEVLTARVSSFEARIEARLALMAEKVAQRDKLRGAAAKSATGTLLKLHEGLNDLRTWLDQAKREYSRAAKFVASFRMAA
jgi:hypothetical protein